MSRVSEQIFHIHVKSNTYLSGVGQMATRGTDFEIGYSSFVYRSLFPSDTYIYFTYLIYNDLIPENQEVFLLSITPANNGPPFGCSITNGCYQQIEIVIIDNDGE